MCSTSPRQLSTFACNYCRNRQVRAFYDVVEYFRPAYVLMENVLDILKKEDGTYAKSAMASLLNMRYQVRTGVIAACDQGVPQSRNRCGPACLSTPPPSPHPCFPFLPCTLHPAPPNLAPSLTPQPHLHLPKALSLPTCCRPYAIWKLGLHSLHGSTGSVVGEACGVSS